MRIVIDMQGAQTESRYRGIGRYTMSFAKSIVRNRGEHEIILAVSGLFEETIESIRSDFYELLPQENIRVWHAPGPVKDSDRTNESRRKVAELLREAFLASLKPDIIHVTSLFEGYVDDAVISIGCFDLHTPVSVTLYDLIPLLNSEQYLKPNPLYQSYYRRKINYLNKASCCLAISEFSQQEGVEHLSSIRENIINVSTAIDDKFKQLKIDPEIKEQVLCKYRIEREYILYTGGSDERKNLNRLIQAYASLSNNLRKRFQLVLAGRIPDSIIIQLYAIGNEFGLEYEDLIITGHVPDDHLIMLYNLCYVFVFPSWHEGFGLPALEAMACGAAVIGANTTSIPEVIGLSDALFDPMNINSIAQKITDVLKNDEFRGRLRDHGVIQSKKFSWDAIAQSALNQWQHTINKFHFKSVESRLTSNLLEEVSKVVFNSGSTNTATIAACIAQNSICGIERQLLIDISELYQRDSATGVQRVVRSYLFNLLKNPPSGFRVEPVYATQSGDYCYARSFVQKLHHVGEVKIEDFQPMRYVRGDIFFGLDMQHHIQLSKIKTYKKLKEEGVVIKFMVYDLLPIQFPEYFKDSNASELHDHWLRLVVMQDEAICISKATADALGVWIKDHSIPTAPNFGVRWIHMGADLDGSIPSKGFPANSNEVITAIKQGVTFLIVSTLEPRKSQAQVIDAFDLLWQKNPNINLVLVGQLGWKVENLSNEILNHFEFGKRLFWLRGISDEYLDLIYKNSTCLIAASINEGFGLPLIEAARYGVPVIARDIPVFREVAGESAFFFSGNSGTQLAQAISEWLILYEKEKIPSSGGMKWSTWKQSTEVLKDILVGGTYTRKQILVDISELIQRDARTGIQRVVRNILNEWLKNPPEGFKIEPVFAASSEPYRYARRFTAQFLGHNFDDLSDDLIEFAPGDLFFGLDFQPQVQAEKVDFYRHLRQQGVVVKFMVYDLLCVLQPKHFPSGSALAFSKWLNVICQNNGVICISNTVAAELKKWIKSNSIDNTNTFDINSNPLGVDIQPPMRLPDTLSECIDGEDSFIRKMKSRPSFLMVGTLEPRKGHSQVLSAFECMWSEGLQINLVIVGKCGWMVDELVSKLRNHSEAGKNLHWLDRASDEYLDKVYAHSTCLIAASYGEGFGLPIIEAAKYKLPIICRDIEVFREVAGEHAFYFDTENAAKLAEVIKKWIKLKELGKHQKSNGIPLLTWKESAEKLGQLITGKTNS